MNKRVQAMDKARTWKERRTGDYIERLDSSGVVFERTYSPQKAKPVARPQPLRPQPLRPQAPKVKPVPQQKDFNYGRPPGVTDADWGLYKLGELSRKQQTEDQLKWFNRMNQTAKESQLSNQTFGLKLQSGINETNVRTKYIDKETAGVIGKSNENVARIQGTSAGKVAEIEGGWRLKSQQEQTRSNLGVAEIQGRTSNYASDRQLEGLKYQSDADKYTSDNVYKGIQYQSDRIAETENKKTDSNFFIEREKNATQREKNKQDLFLNAGLGILDSINKQRASSSQAAAQIYSSYLSSNPYSFKYWD